MLPVDLYNPVRGPTRTSELGETPRQKPYLHALRTSAKPDRRLLHYRPFGDWALVCLAPSNSVKDAATAARWSGAQGLRGLGVGFGPRQAGQRRGMTAMRREAVNRHMPEHDPGSRFEDEGIPDLQDGTPQQQWAVDPQEAPLPGDRPVAAEDFGTTAGEQIEGEPLDGRLAREEPEEQAVLGTVGTPWQGTNPRPVRSAGGRPRDRG